MSNFRRNDKFQKSRMTRKSFTTFSALALACMAAISQDALADDDLLQFERVNPSDVLDKVVQGMHGTGTSSAEAAAQRSAASAQMIQSVRESLAAPAKPMAPEVALEFEPLSPARMSAPDIEIAPEQKRPSSTLSVSGAPLRVELPQQSLLGNAQPSAQLVTNSERDLREMFLRVVEAAAGRSPAIARALAERSASEAEIAEAKGLRYPQVDIGARGVSREFGPTRQRGTGDPTLTLGVTTPVFDWGRIRKTIESRTHLADAADFAWQAELESSAYDATANLVELAKQRTIVRISQQYVDRMSELVRMLEGIVAVDSGRVSELTQARARLLQAEASRSMADAKARDIEINLRKMIGDRPLPPLPESQYWAIGVPELSWLLAESLNHPIVRQAKAQARSADTQADAVRSSLLPQVNWVVSKSTGDDAYGRESAWQTGLTLSWSAFRGGSGRAAEQAARQRAQAGWMGAEQQIQDLEYRIRAANQDAKSLADRADLYRGLSIESDKIRVAFYEQWYHLGRRTLLDVLSSESEHYNNQVGEVSQRFDSYQAVIRQYASAGALVRWLSDGR